MRVAVLAFASFVLALTSQALAQVGRNAPPPDQTVVYRTLASGETLSIWVYRPTSAGVESKTEPAPAIVFYHGGGWRDGTPAQIVSVARHFVDLGFVVLLPEYRVNSRHGTSIIDSTADGRSAMRFVMQKAGELGIDPARIVAAGSSAGGHIAAALATTDEVNNVGDNLLIDPRPAALLLFSAAVNLKGLPGIATNSAVNGGALAGRPFADMLVADPMTHLKADLPPCILFHGTEDATVPFQSVKDFAQAATAAGAKCELVSFEGRPHVYFRPERSLVDFSATMERADAFLKEHGLLPER
jgi:acetyl esterase/lipase